MTNPILYALADQYNQEFFYNLASEEDDMEFPSFNHFLPTREMAENFIEDQLCEDYVVVEVQLVSYREGVISVQYTEPDRWRE
ncbi:hypothetical protein [Paenibacillus chitinolyticus]|uniref:hypothetical protein n=1 Tax=Paenibacillus chitinolyticus TaxID=79263 RepID=UPI00365A6530